VSFADVRPGMPALYVACGPGTLAAELAQLPGSLASGAVEPGERYVDACRTRVPGTQADALQAVGPED
jgi:ubiquinone/menaquinone biosynthesis C-methylase UbiE